MLTKIELNQKKAKSSEQLDLVDTITSDDKIHKKRMFVISAISITIGLSLVFWIYRSFKTVSISLPQMPKFAAISKNDINTDISTIIGKDSQNWEINYVDKFDTSKLKYSQNSLIKDLLPLGVDVKENYTQTDTAQTLQALITLPQQNIYLSIKYRLPDQNTFKTTLQKLIPPIYWFKVQSS